MSTYLGTTPVPNPRTWTSGERVTAARLGTFAQAIDFLAAPPIFQGRCSTGTTVPTATHTAVPIDIEDIDTRTEVGGGHSTQTNTSRYYVPYKGWYFVSGRSGYNYTAGSSGFGHIASINILQGGVTLRMEGGKGPGASNHQPGHYVADLISLDPATNDYVELLAYQATGANQVLNTNAAKYPQLNAQWVAAATGSVAIAVPAPAAWPIAPAYLTSAFLNGYRDHVRFLAYPPIARLMWTGVTPATQSTPTQGWPGGTAVTFDNTWVDNYGGWNGGNPTRYTFQRAGRYLLYGQVAWPGNTNATRGAGLRINGGTTQYGGHEVPANAGTLGHTSVVQRELRVAAGDYVELVAFQNTAGVLALKAANSDASHCKLIAIWVGA